jgi:hypothetical protein
MFDPAAALCLSGVEPLCTISRTAAIVAITNLSLLRTSRLVRKIKILHTEYVRLKLRMAVAPPTHPHRDPESSFYLISTLCDTSLCTLW